MSPLVYILLGLALGGVIGWLFRSVCRPQTADNRLEEELRQQVVQRESELAQLRSQLAETGSACAAADALKASAERALGEQRQLQEKALGDLREAFKALSADALKQTAPDFLRLANETLSKFQESAKGDLE